MKRIFLLILLVSMVTTLVAVTQWTLQAAPFTVYPLATHPAIPRSAPANASSSPYLTLDAPGGAVLPGGTVPYAVQLTNYGKTSQVVTVTAPIPANVTLDDAGPFSLVDTTLVWQGELPGAHLSYAPVAADLPYIDLADYGIPSICETLAGGDSCDDLIVTTWLGELDSFVTLFERRLDYVFIGANGFVAGPAAAIDPSAFISNTTGINLTVPQPDALNQLIAPLWRDNALDVTVGQGVYVAVIEQFTPTAAQSLYVNWHVSLQDAPHAVAAYGVAIDLGDSGHVYFVYDHIAAPDDVAAAGYTIGLEDADGERGYLQAYAPPPTGEGNPVGYLPVSNSAIQWYPHFYADPAAAHTTLPFVLTAPADPRASVQTTVFGRTTTDFFWSTAVTKVRNLTYLPIAANTTESTE